MTRDRLHFLLLNIGHFLDHLFTLIFATVAALVLYREWGVGYAELLAYATPGFFAFGLFALPAGWLADRWSRDGMMVVFFAGIGLASIATGFASTPLQIGIGLFVIGMFAAIYHPVGLGHRHHEVAQHGHADRRQRCLGQPGRGQRGIDHRLPNRPRRLAHGFHPARTLLHRSWVVAYLIAPAPMEFASWYERRSKGPATGFQDTPRPAAAFADRSLLIAYLGHRVFHHRRSPRSSSSRPPSRCRKSSTSVCRAWQLHLSRSAWDRWGNRMEPKSPPQSVGSLAFLTFAVASMAQLVVGGLLDRYGPRPGLSSPWRRSS